MLPDTNWEEIFTRVKLQWIMLVSQMLSDTLVLLSVLKKSIPHSVYELLWGNRFLTERRAFDDDVAKPILVVISLPKAVKVWMPENPLVE